MMIVLIPSAQLRCTSEPGAKFLHRLKQPNPQHLQQLVVAACAMQEVVHRYYTRLLEDTIGARPAGPALDMAMASLGLTPSNVKAQTKVRFPTANSRSSRKAAVLLQPQVESLMSAREQHVSQLIDVNYITPNSGCSCTWPGHQQCQQCLCGTRMPLPRVMCGDVHLQVVGGMLQVAGSAPAAPQLAAVLPAEQVALLQSLRPLISQQNTGSQDNTALPNCQVSSTALSALLDSLC
jgi:hypothetical protein